MKPFTPDDSETKSADILAKNVAAFQALPDDVKNFETPVEKV